MLGLSVPVEECAGGLDGFSSVFPVCFLNLPPSFPSFPSTLIESPLDVLSFLPCVVCLF